MWIAKPFAAVGLVCLVACGGGASTDGFNTSIPFSVGGTVTGLKGTGLVLQDNGGDDTAISSNGAFSFPTMAPSGSAYTITVSTEPTNPKQTCTLTGGTGVVGGADVTSVLVTCTTDASRFAFVVNTGSNTVSTYAIALGTGVLSPTVGSPFTVGTSPQDIVITPSGKHAYVSSHIGTAGMVAAYAVDAQTGALSELAITPAAIAGLPNQASDPAGKFLYVGGENSVYGYTIDDSTGALTSIAGSPFSGTPAPAGVAALRVHPSGNFLYVANTGGHNVLGYSINASSGALTQLSGSPFTIVANPAPTVQPVAIAFDPTGNFAYVIADSTIYSYSVDPGTGALTAIAGSSSGAAGTFPRAIAVNATGTTAYVADASSGQLSAYSIGPTGALTFVNGSTVNTGQLPINLIVHPSGFVYTANWASGDVSAFNSAASGGAATPIVGSPFAAGTNPNVIVLGD